MRIKIFPFFLSFLSLILLILGIAIGSYTNRSLENRSKASDTNSFITQKTQEDFDSLDVKMNSDKTILDTLVLQIQHEKLTDTQKSFIIYEIGKSGNTALTSIVEQYLSNKNPYLQRTAVRALYQLDPKKMQSLSLNLLSNTSPETQNLILFQLSQQTLDQELLQKLEQMYMSNTNYFQQPLFISIFEKNAYRPVSPYLEQQLIAKNVNDVTKDAIVVALQKIGTEKSFPLLQKHKTKIAQLLSNKAVLQNSLIKSSLENSLQLVNQTISKFPQKTIMQKSISIPKSVRGITRSPSNIVINTVYQSQNTGERIVIIFDHFLYTTILNTSEYGQWISDLENDGHTVTVADYESGDPQDIRTYIETLNTQQTLTGIIIVGDVPSALYEDATYGYEVFPIDHYYADLDGLWLDSDNNGCFDSVSGSPTPEVWVGRIKTTNLNSETNRDEIGILRYYLAKNHLYRTQTMTFENHALSYVDNDWTFALPYGYMNPAFQSVETISDHATTNSSDYLNRLGQNYKMIDLVTHSGTDHHYFEGIENGGGYVYTSNLINKNSSPFINDVACNNANYLAPNYMAGHYVFNRKNGLLLIGSTSKGGLIFSQQLYINLEESNNTSFGDAFKIVFTGITQNPPITWNGVRGLVILGDPTLHLNMQQIPTPTPTPTSICSPKPAPSSCDGRTLCEAANCWNVDQTSPNWSYCQQFDYNGNCTVDITEIQQCAYTCSTNGTEGSCCTQSIACDATLTCNICFNGMGVCAQTRPPSPSPTPIPTSSPTPYPGCHQVNCDANTDGYINSNDGIFVHSCFGHQSPLNECQEVDINCDNQISVIDIQRYAIMCPQIFEQNKSR